MKLEVTPEPGYLWPDGDETLKAARILVKEGFVVLPYIGPDPVLARKLEDAGTAAVMPLAAPIGSNRGIRSADTLRIIIEHAGVPVVVDAGLGAPSDAALAMEMGADAVMVNTAISDLGRPGAPGGGVQARGAGRPAGVPGRPGAGARHGAALVPHGMAGGVTCSTTHTWPSSARPWRRAVHAEDARKAAAAVERESLRFEDFLALLSPGAAGLLDAMALRSRALTQRHFGRNIGMYIPLYLSNECTNECVYCGFNRTNRINRRTLTGPEVERELEAIKQQGYDAILLLTGEAPARAGLDYIARCVASARRHFSQVSLEIYPMDTDGYRKLVDAGATGLTLYQETYDRETYARVHLSGASPISSGGWTRPTGPPRRASAGSGSEPCWGCPTGAWRRPTWEPTRPTS